MLRQFGLPEKSMVEDAKSASFHSGNLYAAVLDEAALWDPATIDAIVRDFPKGLIEEADLYLILSECFANAALHGRAQALGLYTRVRAGVMLLSFFQLPPMMSRVALVLKMARDGAMRDYLKDDETTGGLGFPILLKLTHAVTISQDFKKLRLWFRLKPNETTNG